MSGFLPWKSERNDLKPRIIRPVAPLSNRPTAAASVSIASLRQSGADEDADRRFSRSIAKMEVADHVTETLPPLAEELCQAFKYGFIMLIDLHGIRDGVASLLLA